MDNNKYVFHEKKEKFVRKQEKNTKIKNKLIDIYFKLGRTISQKQFICRLFQHIFTKPGRFSFLII